MMKILPRERGILTMTVQEVFEQWKSYAGLEDTCSNAECGYFCGYDGFSQCRLVQLHPDVRYGINHCPKNCPDYVRKSKSELFSSFYSYYKNHASYFNDEYRIPDSDPMKYPPLERIQNIDPVKGQLALNTVSQIADVDPEIIDDFSDENR